MNRHPRGKWGGNTLAATQRPLPGDSGRRRPPASIAPADHDPVERTPMAIATLRCYAELNDFLPPARRQRDWPLTFAAPAPVRHLVELAGVPHTEVELVLLNGTSVDLEAAVFDGDRIAVYPMFEAFDIRPALRLRRQPLRRPRFIADAHLGALARRLRMLGFDTLWFNDIGDAELARLAASEQRILLSRDRRLLMRQAVTHGCFIRAGPTWRQLADLVERLQLCAEIAPFRRCTVCNATVEPVSPAAVHGQVPPGVRAREREFWCCAGCGRVYWKGSHWRAMQQRIAGLCPAQALPPCGQDRDRPANG